MALVGVVFLCQFFFSSFIFLASVRAHICACLFLKNIFNLSVCLSNGIHAICVSFPRFATAPYDGCIRKILSHCIRVPLYRPVFFSCLLFCCLTLMLLLLILFSSFFPHFIRFLGQVQEEEKNTWMFYVCICSVHETGVKWPKKNTNTQQDAHQNRVIWNLRLRRSHLWPIEVRKTHEKRSKKNTPK